MTSPRAARDPWLDNAKMALVTLVVVGHLWALLPGDGALGHVYHFLYAWHMPAFVFVTGYLSKSFDFSRRRVWALVRTVAIPYVIFECLMAFYREWLGGEQLRDLFADPHWPLWFLTALIAWRLLTPLFRSLPLPTAIALAICVGVGSATITGDLSEYFDLTRAAGMLPFFVLGLHTSPERLEVLRGAGARWAAVGTFGLLWLVTSFDTALGNAEWLYYATPYADLGVSDSEGVLTRLALMAVGVAAGAAFLALVPRRGGWFTRMGSATLVVYLCHGFIVRGLAYSDYPDWTEQHVVLAAVLTVVGGILLSLTLAAPPVRKRLLFLVDPFGRAEQQVTQAVELTLEAAQAPVPGAPGSLPAMETQPANTAAR